jgi:uncharacterized protein (TIGR00730 family)
MQAIRSVGIFLGSSTGINPLFGRKIADLCETFARRSIAVVYGGGNVGLMGLLADTAIKNGLHVTGVIPRNLIERELGHDGIQDLRIVETMHERKALMTRLSDAFLVLPGGIGTMDEFFEVFTWYQLGLHNHPIGILNTADYYDPLKIFLLTMVREGFLRRETYETLIFEASAERILDRMEERLAAEKKDSSGLEFS